MDLNIWAMWKSTTSPCSPHPHPRQLHITLKRGREKTRDMKTSISKCWLARRLEAPYGRKAFLEVKAHIWEIWDYFSALPQTFSMNFVKSLRHSPLWFPTCKIILPYSCEGLKCCNEKHGHSMDKYMSKNSEKSQPNPTPSTATGFCMCIR